MIILTQQNRFRYNIKFYFHFIQWKNIFYSIKKIKEDFLKYV